MSKLSARHLLCKMLGHDWSLAVQAIEKAEPDRLCERCGARLSDHDAKGQPQQEPPKPWPRSKSEVKPDISGSHPPRPFYSSKVPQRPDRAPVAEWLDPEVYPPPHGTKILLLTNWEVAVLGHWDDVGCVAWAPLMKKPEWLQKRLRERRLNNAKTLGREGAIHVERRDVPKRRATD